MQAGYAELLFKINVAFVMLVPILAGFIAYAMGDRPAWSPASSPACSVEISAGFLGGLIGGLLAGAIVVLIKQVKVPRGMASIMPVVVIPLVSTFVVGALMLVVIGQPIAALQEGLTNWLEGLSGSNAILLGIILGLMMAFDMGGPVNKVAYALGWRPGQRQPQDHGAVARRRWPAAGRRPGHRGPQAPVHQGRAPGRRAPGCWGLRSSPRGDPLRRRRPPAGDPGADGRERGRRRPGDELRRRSPGRRRGGIWVVN